MCYLLPCKITFPIVDFWIDDDFGGDAFSFQLENGKSGTVHIDHILEYNRDPGYMTELLLYKLTVEAKKYVDSTQLNNFFECSICLIAILEKLF